MRGAFAGIAVNLELRPVHDTIAVDEIFHVQLFATAPDAPTGQEFSSLAAILAWDPEFVQLRGLAQIDDYPWLVSAFPDRRTYDVDDYNGTWLDGNAYYIALGQLPTLGSYPNTGPFSGGGLHVVDFIFQALAPSANTLIYTPEDLGGDTSTVVFGSDVPNHPITGDLIPAKISVVPEPGAFALAFAAAVSFTVCGKRFRKRAA